MIVWVSKVKVEGIRGFNGEASVDLGPGLNLLVGRNGAGKTSFLQAIEWCLTGKMRYLEGDEFSREDAIVNLFNAQGVGTVALTLHTPGGELELTRKRRRGKSTTRGASPLTIRAGQRTLEGDEAESYLEEVLGLPLGEISNSVYLHQEELRAILSDDPKERSRTIDKMLGMEEIRSLAEALSSKRNIAVALKQMQTRIETLKRDKVQFAIMTRERVEGARKRLLEKGNSENNLDVVSQVRRGSAISEGWFSLAKKFGFSGSIPEQPMPDVLSISRFVEEMDDAIRAVDRQRGEALQSVYREKAQLEGLKDQLSKAMEDLRELRIVSEEELAATCAALEGEVGSLAKSIGDRTRYSSTLSSIVSALDRAQDRLGGIRSSKASLESQISEIMAKRGDEAAHAGLITKLREESAVVGRSLDGLGSLERLLDSAVDHIAESGPDKCPVCEQNISPEDVLGRIRNKLEEDVSQEISSLKTKGKNITSETQNLENSLRELKDLRGRLLEVGRREMEALKEAETDVGTRLEHDLVLQAQSKKADLQSTEAEIHDLKQKLNQTNAKLAEARSELDRLRGARDRLVSTVKRIQSQLQSQSDENGLAAEIDERIGGIVRREGDLRDATGLDELRKELDILEEVNDFSKSEVELDRIEKEVPSATVLIEDLERRAGSLRDLEASLLSLREVVSEYERKAVGKVVESLEDSFNRYFQSFDPHDHFKRVRVEIEEGQPPVYSIRALGEDQTTYITTRFSSAQMNAAAMALFLAKHEKVSGNLGTILLDDPTQSMDAAHKNAVCKSLQGVVKERQVILATQDEEVKRLTQGAREGLKTFEFSDWKIEGPVIS